MATVYLAEQLSLDRKVAIKIMSPEFSKSDDFRERFLREARTLAKFRHQNVITIYEVSFEDDQWFIVMEYLDGGDLKQRMRTGISYRESLKIVQQIADALSYAHEQHYVHRDIKPENCLFDSEDRLVLTDFGIAKSLEDSQDQNLTQTGLALGSPAYMSPEQYESPNVDYKSDLYSLGVVAYEAFTGERPFRADSAAALLYKHATEPVPKLPLDCAAAQSLVDQLMAKRPAQRPESAAEVSVMVGTLLSALPPSEEETAQIQRAAASAPVDTGGGVTTSSADEETRFEKKRFVDWQLLSSTDSNHVYKVMDMELGNPVAIKIPSMSGADSSVIRRQLRQLLQLSRSINHRGICPHYELYEGNRGAGVVMDYVEGDTLGDWISSNENNLFGTAELRFRMFYAIVEACAVAHAKGPHLALAPDQIIVKPNELTAPVVLNWGWYDASSLPETHYVAPELENGRFDISSDMFSLGLIGYELFTGRTLPDASVTVISSANHASSDSLPYISEVCPAFPRSLDAVIRRMMSVNPVDRPQTANDVLAALRPIELIETFTGLGTHHVEVVRPNQGSQANITSRFDSNKIQLEVCHIPGGHLYLGQTSTTPGRKIEISAFQMDAHPVSNKCYKRFLETTGYTAPPFIDHAHFGRDDCPVVGITWEDARAYADWLGGELPSEVQWEYAARAGNRTIYPWGSDALLPTSANIGGASLETSPVASYPDGRNQFDLWDMCGNVWEWCLDTFEPDFITKVRRGAIDPVFDAEGNEKSLRGGAFDSLEQMGACSFRFKSDQNAKINNIGFRLAYPTEEVAEDAVVVKKQTASKWAKAGSGSRNQGDIEPTFVKR